MPPPSILVLAGLAVYVVASLLLWQVLLKEPPAAGPRSSRPRGLLRLARAFAILIGGAAAAAASLLVVATVMSVGRPGAMPPWAMLATWTIVAGVAMLFIGRAFLIREVVARTCLAVGMPALIMPLATILGFLVAGIRLAGSAAAGPERTVDILGVRLAGHLFAVWVGLGGFCIGLALVIAGDRARRGVSMRRARRHFRASRAGVLSVRGRHR